MATTKISSTRQLAVDGNLDVSSNRIVNVANGINPNDAINKSQLDLVTSGMARGLLDPVQNLAALKALTVSAGIDKYMINVEDMGMFRYDAQSSATSDDVYIVTPTVGAGRWIKMSNQLQDHNSASGHQGGSPTERFHMTAAEHAAATRNASASQSGILSSADYQSFAGKQASLGFAAFADRATPSGTKNGSNVIFTLAHTPVSGSEHLYLNGVLQEPGAGNDYTISGATITMAVAPQSTDKLIVSYRRN